LKNLTLLLVSSFLLVVSSACSTIGTIPEVEIKDHKVYADAGNLGATWRTTLSEKKGHLTKADWDALRLGMICSKSDVIEHNTAIIEQFCYYTGRCTYEEVQETVGKFRKIARKVKSDASDWRRQNKMTTMEVLE
jgi:hypothetical protein